MKTPSHTHQVVVGHRLAEDGKLLEADQRGAGHHNPFHALQFQQSRKNGLRRKSKGSQVGVRQSREQEFEQGSGRQGDL